MIFLFGPLYSGKRDYACQLLHCGREELPQYAVWDVQELAAQADDLETLAGRLCAYPVVIATETGGGVFPADPAQRAAREAAGRLNALLARRADTVIRVFYGLPILLKGSLPQ